MSEAGSGNFEKFKVFVSYAREDLLFADQLVDALKATGFEPLIDRNRMTGGEEFRDRLGALILECDTVAFVVSSDSIDPESFCAWEITEASRHSKRMIPVLCRPLGEAVVPPRIKSLDYIFFYPDPHVPGSGFGNGLARLIAALNSDLGWLQQHTVLLQRAALWAVRGRDEDSLLRGTLLADAEKWQTNRPRNAPEITLVQREYLEASRHAEEASLRASRERLEEIRAVQAARATALKEAEVALSKAKDEAAAREIAQKEQAEALARAVADQKAKARAQQRAARLVWAVAGLVLLMFVATIWQVHATAQREARVFTSVGEASFLNGYCDRALRLALAGLPPPGATLLSPTSTELDAALSRYSSACWLKLVLALDQSSIIAAAWSPDGQKIATISTDRFVRIWKPETGSIEVLSGLSSSNLVGISFRPDGKALLVEGENSTFILDSTTLKLLVTLKQDENAPISASYSPNGAKILALSGANAVQIWDARTGEPQVELKGHADSVKTARFSPDGSMILTTSRDNTIKLWDAVSGAQSNSIPTPYLVHDAIFSPSGKQFVTHELVTLRVLDTHTGKELKTIPNVSGATPRPPLKFGKKGEFAVTFLDYRVVSWETGSGSKIGEFKGHTDFLTSLNFSPDGSQLLTSSADGTARIWDVKSGLTIQVLKGHSGSVKGAMWSPDGTLAITWADDGRVRVWHTRNPAELPPTTDDPEATLLASSRDGQWLALADKNKQFRLVESATGKDVDGLPGPSQGRGNVRLAAFSGDGKRIVWSNDIGNVIAFDIYSKSIYNVGNIAQEHESLDTRALFLSEHGTFVAVASGRRARIFDVATGGPVSSLEGHADTILVASFSLDEKHVVTGSQDKSARLWDVQTGRQIALLEGHGHHVTSAAFTPDQTAIVTSSLYITETILWNGTSGVKKETYQGSSHGDIIRSFSKSGRFLALGDNQKRILVVDLYNSISTKISVGHENSVTTAVFGHNDEWIASVSMDETARVWDLRTGEQLQRFSRLINRADVVSFEARDTQILASSRFVSHTFKRYALSPTLGMSTAERRSYVCETALIGAQEFRADEMNDVVLRGSDDLRNPCRRRGPLSLRYYAQTASYWWEWVNMWALGWSMNGRNSASR